MSPIFRAAYVSFAVFVVACSPKGDGRSGDSGIGAAHTEDLNARAESSAVAFVRRFYQSYTRRGVASGLLAADSVIAERANAFSPELLQALRRDAKTRADARGEIAGLDFDPFLGGQDPCDKYEVGTPARSAARASLFIPIFAVCGGKRDTIPTVIAEVGRRKNEWEFANFRYPGTPGPDLLETLNQR